MYTINQSNAYISDNNQSFQFGLALAKEHLLQISSLSEKEAIEACHVGFKCENLFVVIQCNDVEKKFAIPAIPKLNSRLSSANTMAAIRGYIQQLERGLMVELDPSGFPVEVNVNSIMVQ